MAIILRQSTQIVVRVGPFVDATDAVTPETGITLGAADQAEALKAAGAATADISAATWAAITGSDGWYNLTLTTSHTDTVGELEIVVQDSSVCLPVRKMFQVVEEAVYDALFAASALGYVANAPVNVAQFGGSNGTFSAGRPEVNTSHWAGAATATNDVALAAAPTNFAALAITATGAVGINWGNVENQGSTVALADTTVATATTLTVLPTIPTGWLTADGLATDAVQEIRNAITGGAYALSTDANGRIRIVDGTATGELDTSSGTVTLTDGSLTAAKIATGAFAAAKFPADYTTLLETTIDAELESYKLHMLLHTPAVAVADDSAIALLAATGGVFATFDKATDSLQSLRDALPTVTSGGVTLANTAHGGSSATITFAKMIGASSGNDPCVSLTGSGSGQGLHVQGGLTAPGGYFRGGADGGEGLHVLSQSTSYGMAIQGGTGSTGGLLCNSATGAGAVLNGGTTGAGLRLVGGTTGHGLHITGGGTSGDGINVSVTSGDLLDADVVNQIRNAITGGAYDLDTDANGRIRIVDGTGAGELDTNSGAIASVLALGTQAKADVNAEVLDVIATDTYAEPGQGTPTATATLAAKINYLYKTWRNKKTQTSSLLNLFADDASTVDQKSAVSDDGTTLTVGEVATGP